jgi:uncharacterized protein YndB with AHSA1/START domain
MKYTLEVSIGASREDVIELFVNNDNLQKWQEGLIEVKLINGERREKGAKTLLKYDEEGQIQEIMEEIITFELPDMIEYVYTTDSVWNSMVNKFIIINEQHTKWITENEFKFSGEMADIDDSMQGVFEKETLAAMNRFKNFVQKQ